MSFFDEEKNKYMFRAQLILNNLKTSNSGSDIHEVEGMRATAKMLLQSLLIDKLDLNIAKEVLSRLEAKQILYFKKKVGKL